MNTMEIVTAPIIYFLKYVQNNHFIRLFSNANLETANEFLGPFASHGIS